MREALTFDDVNIIPAFSNILSRADCDLTTRFTKTKNISIPIISSPMDTITEYDMALAMMKLGGVGVIHRFMKIEDQVDIVRALKSIRAVAKAQGDDYGEVICAAIGVTKDYFERAEELVKNGVEVLLLDVAHGHHELVKNALERLKNELETEIIAGSIATKEAATELCEWGADSLRLGIGNGSLCESRIRTGIGIPSISAIIDCADIADSYNVPIIADGGIRVPGDVAKGMVAGASCVMLGSLLSGTKETPGPIMRLGPWPNEQLYKSYRGSASQSSKIDRGEDDKNIEGSSQLVKYKGKVKRIVSDINDGVRSSMSYVGARTIEEFQNNAEFVKVTQSGVIEAQPHGIK